MLIAEYRYNGLGHRIAEHYDVDVDNDVDSSDPWYYYVYDDQWRIVATYRGNGAGTTRDSDPKEQFVYHHAGLAEPDQASSYIDAVIMRDRDANSGWANAADSTMEERIFYCQNWRADVVALIGSAGQLLQHVRYGEYGDPFGMPAGDADGDGDYDVNDYNTITAWETFGPYDVRGDIDLDGDIDTADYNPLSFHSLGWGKLSESSIGNRKGYAGYEADHVSARRFHVRNRVYDVTLGRWMTRDPIGYADGWNLYEYVSSDPIGWLDPFGLFQEDYDEQDEVSSEPLRDWSGPLVNAPGVEGSDDLQELDVCDAPLPFTPMGGRIKLEDAERGFWGYIGKALLQEAWDQRADIALSFTPGGAPLKVCRFIGKLGRVNVLLVFKNQKHAREAAKRSGPGPWRKDGRIQPADPPHKVGERPHYHDNDHDKKWKPNVHYGW